MLKIKNVVKIVKTLNEVSGLVNNGQTFIKNNIKKNVMSSYSHVITSVDMFVTSPSHNDKDTPSYAKLTEKRAHLYRLLHFIYKCDNEAFKRNFKVNKVIDIESRIQHGIHDPGIGDFSYNIMIDNLTVMNVTVKPMVIHNNIGKVITSPALANSVSNFAEGSYPEIVVTFIGINHKMCYNTLYNYMNLSNTRRKLVKKESSDGKLISIAKGIQVRHLRSDSDRHGIVTYFETIFLKDMSSIFIDSSDKFELLEYIHGWNINLDLMKMYNEKSIAYSTSILLYGEPGCGKSSLIRTIISHMYSDYVHRNDDASILIVSVDAIIKDPTRALFDPDIRTSLDDVVSRYDLNKNEVILNTVVDIPPEIWIFEDIDSLFVNRKDVKDKELAAAQNAFLQFLDGIEGKQKRLIILTTNHLDILEGESEEEKQDSALTRPGRINYRLEVKPATKAIAEEMCLSFNTTLEEIAPGFGEDETIRQSKLEQMILLKMAKENGGKEID